MATASAPRSWKQRSASLPRRGAALELERIEIGESVYNRGLTNGIEPASWESLRRTKVFLKAPITTPQGGGFKSLNVTVRKTLGMYANVRPCSSLHPYVSTKHPNMDIVIVRENEEDVYGGIEHRQTNQVAQCLKLISRPGSKRIIRYAFEYARRQQAQKSHVLHQRQHHEDHGRPLPPDVRRDRDGVSRRSRTNIGSSISARPKWPTRRKRST